MTQYRRLRREQLNKWVKSLLDVKGSTQQLDLLNMTYTCNPKEFVGWIEKEIAQGTCSAYTDSGSESPSMLDADGNRIIEMTPGHMYMMPAKDIVSIYQHWRDISFSTATSSAFWGATTLRAIQDEHIEPRWLAVGFRDSGELASGHLDKAIQQGGKSCDDMVRRILRWMTAPGQMRGTPELYANCSLAKAWWCGHIAADCSRYGAVSLGHEEAVEALCAIWPEYSTYLAGGLTAAAFPSVYCGLVLWTSRWLAKNENAKLKNLDVRKILRRIGETSSWCLLGLKSPGSIEGLIEKIYLAEELQQNK